MTAKPILLVKLNIENYKSTENGKVDAVLTQISQSIKNATSNEYHVLIVNWNTNTPTIECINAKDATELNMAELQTLIFNTL